MDTGALASSGNGNVTFRNLGRGLLWGDNKIDGYREEGKGIAYLPVVHERGILKPFAAPVILYEGGEVRSLRPILSDTESVTLHRKYPKYNKIASDVHDSNEVIPGDDYELFYWNDEWCSLGRKTAGHDTLVYVEVPKNALLWLHNHTQGRKSGFLRMKTESRFGGNMGWIVRMKKKMQEFMAMIRHALFVMRVR